MISTFRKSDTVFYRPQGGTASYIVRARVERAHRDGSVTIRALFEVDPQTGNDIVPGSLGYRYRVDPVGLHSTPAAA